MADSTAILDELEELGIAAEVRGGERLILKPRDLVGPQLLSKVKSVKADVIRRLRLREYDADRPDAEGYLLNRLRRGVVWLNATQDSLNALPDAGLITATELTPHGHRTRIKHSRLSAQFLNGYDAWFGIELCLREVLDYRGCVLGADAPCAPDSVVRCQACLRLND